MFGGAGERSGGTGSPQAASETGGGMKGGEEKSGDNPQGGKHKNPVVSYQACRGFRPYGVSLIFLTVG